MALFDIFTSGRFAIPAIQRDYEWLTKTKQGENQARNFLDDLWRYHSEVQQRPDHYFLGTTVVYNDPRRVELQIMDGQQRLTTTTALIAGIKSHLEEYREGLEGDDFEEVNNFILDEIDDVYFYNRVGTKAYMRLAPKESSSNTVIRAIKKLKGKVPKEAIVPPKEGKKTLTGGKNILDATQYFYVNVLKLAKKKNPQDPYQELIAFVQTISQKVIITLTETENVSLAFQMYTSVNGPNAKPLNIFDLFRALLVQHSHVSKCAKLVEPKVNELNESMSGIRRMGNPQKALENALTYWHECRTGRNVATSAVIGELSRTIQSFTEASEYTDVMDDFRDFAIAYDKLSNTSAKEMLAEGFPGYLANRRILAFGGGYFWSSAHALFYTPLAHSYTEGSYSPEDVEKVMDLVEWFYIRGWHSKGGSALEPIFPKIGKNVATGQIYLNLYVFNMIMKNMKILILYVKTLINIKDELKCGRILTGS